MTKKMMICVFATVLSSLVLSAESDQEQNQGQRRHHGGGRPEMSAEMKAALDECHTSLNIAKPDRNSDTRPTREQMDKLKACVEAQGFELPAPPEHRGEFNDQQQDRPQKKRRTSSDGAAQ